jgi:hypothetical protein
VALDFKNALYRTYSILGSCSQVGALLRWGPREIPPLLAALTVRVIILIIAKYNMQPYRRMCYILSVYHIDNPLS